MREFAIPVSLISGAKRHPTPRTHVKSQAPTGLGSPTSSERDRHDARSLPPFFSQVAHRAKSCLQPLAGEQPQVQRHALKQLAFLERWR